MAELADALDSGRVTSVTTFDLESAPPSERSLRVKINDQNCICGYGGIGRRVRFRLRHLGDNF